MYLQATVTYEDKFGAGKMESMVSESSVEDRTRANAAPSFKGQDETGPDVDDQNEGGDPAGIQDDIIVTRNVDEMLKGANVGKPVIATDSDNDVLLYTIDKASQANFSIGSRSGQLKAKNDKLVSDNDGFSGINDDGDTTNGTNTDDNGETTHMVTVTATDPSGAKTPQVVTVTINDVNDAPKITAGTSGAQNRKVLTVAENVDTSDATGDLDADPTNGATIDAPTFVALDADAGDVNASADGAGDATTVATVRITYSLEGADKDKFQLSATTSDNDTTGVTLSFKSDQKVNYEKQDEYEITIVAEDDSVPEGRGTLDVTVNVTNEEDTGDVILSQREPQVGKELVATLEDQDGNLHGQSWQWYRDAGAVTADSELVAVNATPTDPNNGLCTAATGAGTLCRIENATSPNYTPVQLDRDKKLAARVTYTDTHVTLDTSTPPVEIVDTQFLVSEEEIQVENPANTAPKFSDDQDPNTSGDQADAARSVDENEDEGTNVGDPVTASDKDKLIYSLGGADMASFEIDSGLGKNDTAGQIKTAVKLDYETKSMYMVVVTATDPSGATDTVNVMISVNDVNDKPTITLVTEDDKAIKYAENGTEPVASFEGMDQDNDDIEWSLAGDDAADFDEDVLNDTGDLVFKVKPNYESAHDQNKDNKYLVTVQATSNGQTAKHELEITVTDEDEPGEVTLSQPQPQVGRSLVASLSDPDADVADEQWQWARSASADGPWADIDKATSASRSPVADDLNMYLQATVTYEDKFGAGKMESMVSESSVEDRTRANAAPSFKGQDETGPDVDDQNEGGDPAGIQDDIIVTRNVDEMLKGANVGKPVIATDSDNDVLLYTIDKASQANFSIGSRSGQLKAKNDKLVSDNDGFSGINDDGDTTNGTNTDDNGETTHMVTVTATDPSGAKTPQVVTVTINDVNDAPKITAGTSGAQNRKVLTVAENVDTSADDTTPVIDADTAAASIGIDAPTFVALDADAGDVNASADGAGDATTVATVRITYSLEGADKDKFQLSAATSDDDTTGVTLSFKSDQKVNYEKQKKYEITIVAEDDSVPEGRGTLDVTVNVTNEEDTGDVILSQREPQVGKELVATLEDEDGNLHGQSWQWFRAVTDPATVFPDTTSDTEKCDADTLTNCWLDGATSPNYTPVRLDNGNKLTARVMYTDGHVTLDTAVLLPLRSWTRSTWCRRKKYRWRILLTLLRSSRTTRTRTLLVTRLTQPGLWTRTRIRGRT